MPEEWPSRRIRKIREESQRKLRDLTVQLGISLLNSKGVALPEMQTERERIAQIQAFKHLIRDMTRELDSWIQHRDRAAKQGMTKEAQFRQQMITGMENQLERHKEELRRLQSLPGSTWSGST
jgi:glutamyl-tRNA reductase